MLHNQPRDAADSTKHTLERESPVVVWITLHSLVSCLLVFHVELLVVHVSTFFVVPGYYTLYTCLV